MSEVYKCRKELYFQILLKRFLHPVQAQQAGSNLPETITQFVKPFHSV